MSIDSENIQWKSIEEISKEEKKPILRKPAEAEKRRKLSVREWRNIREEKLITKPENMCVSKRNLWNINVSRNMKRSWSYLKEEEKAIFSEKEIAYVSCEAEGYELKLKKM